MNDSNDSIGIVENDVVGGQGLLNGDQDEPLLGPEDQELTAQVNSGDHKTNGYEIEGINIIQGKAPF